MKLVEILNLYKLSSDPDKLPGFDDYKKAKEQAAARAEENEKKRLEIIKALGSAGDGPYFTFPIKGIGIKMQVGNISDDLLKKIEYFNKNIATPRSHRFREVETVDQMIAREAGLYINSIPVPPTVTDFKQGNPATFNWGERVYTKQYEALAKILERNGVHLAKVLWTTKMIDKGWTTYKSNSFISFVGTINNPKIIWYRNGSISPLGSSNKIIFAPATPNKKQIFTSTFLTLTPAQQDKLVQMALTSKTPPEATDADEWKTFIRVYAPGKSRSMSDEPLKIYKFTGKGKTAQKVYNAAYKEVEKHPENFMNARIYDPFTKPTTNHISVDWPTKVKK